MQPPACLRACVPAGGCAFGHKWMFASVCMPACLRAYLSACLRVCACVCACVRVCLCVCVWLRDSWSWWHFLGPLRCTPVWLNHVDSCVGGLLSWRPCTVLLRRLKYTVAALNLSCACASPSIFSACFSSSEPYLLYHGSHQQRVTYFLCRHLLV